MCFQISPEPYPGYNSLLDLANDSFVVVFNLEAALKLGAMRSAYFNIGWNRFDFICVIVADIGLALQIAKFDMGSAVASLSVVFVVLFGGILFWELRGFVPISSVACR